MANSRTMTTVLTAACVGCVVGLASLGLTNALQGGEADVVHVDSTTLTPTQVDGLINDLGDRTRRLMALDQLLTFAPLQIALPGSLVVTTGKAETDALMERAAVAVRRMVTAEVLGAAVEAPEHQLQIWAMEHLRPRIFSEGAPPVLVMVRVRQLAGDPDAHTRGAAQDCLGWFPGQQEILAACLRDETTPWNILKLLQHHDPHYQTLMAGRLLTLLASDNAHQRIDALEFIGFNSSRAPMWQIDLSSDLLPTVLAMTHATSEEERGVAVYAITEPPLCNDPLTITRLLEMARDPSVEVRWRIPRALTSHKDQPAVRLVLTALLNDASPQVRFFTVLALDPEPHVDVLEALATGTDAKIAAWAKTRLDLQTRTP